MVKNSFSTTWKSATQVRKQRKYRHNAPLHIKQKMLHVHLAAGLRKKHSLRNVQVRVGDKVKILRGSSKGKEGKVQRVDLKHEKIYVASIENVKGDGTKTPLGLAPSNLLITELDLGDKKRKLKVERQGKASPAKREERKEVKEEPKNVETQEGRK